MNLQKELEPIKDRLLKIIDKLETVYNIIPEVYSEVSNIQKDLDMIEINAVQKELNASELNNEQEELNAGKNNVLEELEIGQELEFTQGRMTVTVKRLE